MVNYQPTIDRNLSMVKSQTRIERDRAGPTSKLWRPMGDDSVFQLAGFVFLATLLGFGQTMPDPWLILSGGKTGSINAHTTRNDLVRLYGTANVVDQDVDVGEGEMQSATFLFPKDPERRIETQAPKPRLNLRMFEGRRVAGTPSMGSPLERPLLSWNTSMVSRFSGP